MRISMTLWLTLGLCCSVAASAITIGNKSILLEDDKVQVVRLVYPPNTESGLHQHEFASRTIYVVKGGTLALISASGEQKEITVQAGQVMRVPAAEHNVRNIGDTVVELIETELKY